MRVLTKVILIITFVFSLANCLSAQTTLHVPSQYSTIQAALNAATTGDTVLVQPGTYQENLFWPNINGIQLTSAGDTSNTIISGNQQGSTITMISSGIIDSTTVIDGFKITNGGSVQYGGGILLNNSGLKIVNSKISNNEANKGGGIYLVNYSELIIESCLILSNNATNSPGQYDGDGGGLYADQYSNVNIINSAIMGNNGDYHGGGIFIDGESFVMLDNVEVSLNTADYGGGICLKSYCEIQILNSEVRDNIGFNDAGGVYSRGQYSLIDIENSVVSFNQTDGRGGGILTTGSPHTLILSSVIIGYNTANRGGGIYGNFEFNDWDNVIIYRNEANKGGGVYFYWVANYTFSGRIVIAENYAMAEGGGIYIYRYGTHQTIFENFTLYKNSVGNYGGGIYIADYNSGIDMRTTSITENNAGLLGDGVYSQADGNATFLNNNFMFNGEAIYNWNNSLYIEAQNNWWGDTSGPYHPIHNPMGQGDSVNSFVNVLPFLSTPNSNAPLIPIQNLSAEQTDTDSIRLNWDFSPFSDVVGYKIHFDTDSTNIIYENSIDVGDTTEYELGNLQTGITYYISATCYDLDGNESWYCKPLVIELSPPTIHSANSEEFYSFSLTQNYPNPFNPSTTIKYQIPKLSFVEVKVYDVLGNEIAILANEEKPAGSYEIEFDAAGLPSGIYFYKLQAGSFVETKKMVLMK